MAEKASASPEDEGFNTPIERKTDLSSAEKGLPEGKEVQHAPDVPPNKLWIVMPVYVSAKAVLMLVSALSPLCLLWMVPWVASDNNGASKLTTLDCRSFRLHCQQSPLSWEPPPRSTAGSAPATSWLKR